MGIKEDVRASYTVSFERRMRNWARSVAGSSLGFAQVNWDSCGGGSDESPLPILSGEAEDTGKALEKLAIRYRRAVELYWMWGDSDAELTVLGRKCAVDYRTFAGRVIDGHRLLQAELTRAAEAWRTHRERSESMVSAARHSGVDLTTGILQV
ncbi:MAG: hypothetical protein JSS57_04380 [Proteobacteria bacterium]|nr:hypothetical protein [Pseudomonadota bacterium]